MNEEKSKSFERSIERMEAIVKRMEQGDVPLEEALGLFREGTQLVQTCTEALDKAELEVKKLSKSADGTPAETEYIRDE